MPDLYDILALKPKKIDGMDGAFMLARPTICDLLELQGHNESDPRFAKLWCLSRHVLNAQGERLWLSPEAAKLCPAAVAARLFPEIESLYSEGLD